MNTIKKYDFNKFDYYDVLIISDWHIGHKDVQMKEIAKSMDWVKEKENRLILGGGDYIENCSTGNNPAGHSLKTQILNPDQQIDKFVEIMMPVADRIIGLICGNHDFRTDDVAQIDVMRILTKELGCDYLGKTGMQADVKFQFSKYKSHLVHIRHTKFGGRIVDNKLRSLIERDCTETDLLLMGHTHQLKSIFVLKKKPARLKFKLKRIYGVATGSMFSFPEYARRSGCVMGEIGNPVVRFYPDRYYVALNINDTKIWKIK